MDGKVVRSFHVVMMPVFLPEFLQFLLQLAADVTSVLQVGNGLRSLLVGPCHFCFLSRRHSSVEVYL